MYTKTKSTDGLNKITFKSTTDLIAYLQANYVFKVDHEDEHVYVLDQSNPNRSKSIEYKVFVHDDLTCNLSEVK